MTVISIELQGKEKLDQRFSSLLSSWIDLRRVADPLEEVFHNEEKQIFNSSPWTPLDADYERRKARQYPGKGILRRTDQMFNALTSHTSGSIKQASQSQLTLGAGGEAGQRAEWHQLGAGRLPVRQVISDSRGVDRYSKVVRDDMVDFAKAQGFQVI